MLRYYKNTADAARPALVEQSLPTQGEFPSGGLAVPKAADLDGDGLLDLVVGVRENIYLFRNVGTATAPKVAAGGVKPLPATWGNATLPTRQFLDWNQDGWPDYVAGYDVHLNARKGNPYRFEEVVRVLPPGVNIAHPTGIGDDWFWPYLSDFDRDGKIDVLFGDWHGTIWFHRNNGGNAPAAIPSFDTTGYRLKTTEGKEIKVGPIGVDPSANFAALQGARTVFVPADFDDDGLLDLAVADTFGKIRYFRNAGTREAPVFDPAVEVGDAKTRTHLDATDWDRDGRTDIIAGSVNHEVNLFLNKGGKGAARFDKGSVLDLPPVLEPGAVAVDMNRDGDSDLFLTSTQGSVLVERSFAEHGYATSRLIRAEARGR
jgi:large repetitive protein